MKNKIIICLSFCFALFIGLNFVNADSLYPLDLTLNDVPLTEEQLTLAKENGYIIYTYYSNNTYTYGRIVIPTSSVVKFYKKKNPSFGINCIENYGGNFYYMTFRYTNSGTCTITDNFSEHKNFQTLINLDKVDSSPESYRLVTTIPIYTDNTFTDIYYDPIQTEQDDTIGDPNSDLQLSYEYNEDFTECHIIATLKNGAFTDKIYYSNIMPSISGQGLLTKNGFPTERFNSYRKSIFVFPSRR